MYEKKFINGIFDYRFYNQLQQGKNNLTPVLNRKWQVYYVSTPFFRQY